MAWCRISRLSESLEIVGCDLAVAPLSLRGAPIAREDARGHTMTTLQYLAALKRLSLTPAGKATAEALGVSLRQCIRYAHGAPIAEPVAKLLRLLVERESR